MVLMTFFNIGTCLIQIPTIEKHHCKEERVILFISFLHISLYPFSSEINLEETLNFSKIILVFEVALRTLENQCMSIFYITHIITAGFFLFLPVIS